MNVFLTTKALSEGKAQSGIHNITESLIFIPMNPISWKAYGVNNLTDARYFNSLEDAWITFQMDALADNPVQVEKAREIISWLHEPKLVAAFGEHQDVGEISFLLLELGIQHPEVSIFHELALDASFVKDAFLECLDDELEDALTLPYTPYAWVVDVALASPNDGEMIRQLKQLSKKSKLFLHTAADSKEIKQWLKVLPYAGIQLSIVGEEKPGLSQVDVYAEIIEGLVE
jgi:hypothetical protein